MRSDADSAQPVLVAWATDEEVPALAGDIAGVGGSVAPGFAANRRHYVTGIVVLDRDVFDEYDDSAERLADGQATLDHEFGHLVGLDHVDDPGELMHSDSLGRTTYGPGDREGLARLGSVPC